MGIMSDAMYPLREYEPFLGLMVEMENPLMGILVAAVFTALVQSSSATTGIVIVMASQGFITLPAGIAMALGANIGTCVTALLAAIGKSRQAVQASLVHVLFNIAGALLWLSLISELAEMATAVSPSHPDLQGSERLAAETPRQIANANTLFNVINTLLFLPLAGVFGIIVNRLAPLKPETITRAIEPKYLDKALLGSPSLALEHVRMEVGHLGELVVTQLNEFRDAIVSRQRDYLLTIAKQDDRIDSLHDSISVYIESIQKTTLSQSEADQLTALMEASILLEMIGDVVEYDLVPQGLAIIEQGIKYSKTDSVILDKLYESILQAVDTAVHAVTGPDEESADAVLAMKMSIYRHEEEMLSSQRAKLVDKTATTLRQLQSDITLLERMRHIYSLSKRIVRGMYPDKYQSQAAN
jgi:phosphate:Na+ symporter